MQLAREKVLQSFSIPSPVREAIFHSCQKDSDGEKKNLRVPEQTRRPSYQMPLVDDWDFRKPALSGHQRTSMHDGLDCSLKSCYPASFEVEILVCQL
jgi:hypothetical protein